MLRIQKPVEKAIITFPETDDVESCICPNHRLMSVALGTQQTITTLVPL